MKTKSLEILLRALSSSELFAMQGHRGKVTPLHYLYLYRSLYVFPSSSLQRNIPLNYGLSHSKKRADVQAAQRMCRPSVKLYIWAALVLGM